MSVHPRRDRALARVLMRGGLVLGLLALLSLVRPLEVTWARGASGLGVLVVERIAGRAREGHALSSCSRALSLSSARASTSPRETSSVRLIPARKAAIDALSFKAGSMSSESLPPVVVARLPICLPAYHAHISGIVDSHFRKWSLVGAFGGASMWGYVYHHWWRKHTI